MKTISHDGTAVSASRFHQTRKLATEYLGGCNRQGLDWLFDQLAQRSYALLLLLAGYLSEATNWF
jgi:hypothetical protein